MSTLPIAPLSSGARRRTRPFSGRRRLRAEDSTVLVPRRRSVERHSTSASLVWRARASMRAEAVGVPRITCLVVSSSRHLIVASHVRRRTSRVRRWCWDAMAVRGNATERSNLLRIDSVARFVHEQSTRSRVVGRAYTRVVLVNGCQGRSRVVGRAHTRVVLVSAY